MYTDSPVLAARRIVFAALLGLPFAASAQITSSNRDVLLPNTGTAPVGGVTLGGTTFINHGLQGVGRFAANSTDNLGLGETLGSISDMQVTGWASNGVGGYTGTFTFLPDRGYNAGATFSNYAARLNTFDFTFTPYTSTATTTLQNQIVLSYTGSTRFTYDADPTAGTDFRFTTGLVANSSVTFGGQLVPTVAATTTIGADPALANRLTVDAEGLIFDHRAGKAGSGWVSDEYGPYIYHFNASKQIDGVVTLPAAIVPHTGANTDFSDVNATGRRVNQGMEGIAISPDGTRLFAMVQSATLQDSGSGNQGRSNTRILVYDISGSDVPTDPIQQYVLQLPRVDDNGGTAAVNRTAAQSGIIAISNDEIMILSRDGNGRGANNGAPVFKSVLLADLSTGTNIDGMFDTVGADLTQGTTDTLAVGITPVAWTEALNMIGKVDLSSTEIEQFGLNLLPNNGDLNTLSEKWEGLTLLPALDPLAPNDYFLFIGNDNDFQTQTGTLVNGDGSTSAYNAGIENDTMLLAYRVTIVPEPGSALLTAFGALSLGLMRRRSPKS